MKNILIIALSLFTVMRVFAQTPAFDGKNWNAPYTLGFPKGWDVERFLIPIEFAPSIPYKGVEDIRFTPGWGKAETDEYWSYAFLWWLDGKQTMTAETVASNLKAYYTGLVGRNITERKIPADKLVTIQTSFKKIETAKADVQTFGGTVYMLDYMQQKPITLNCIVHVKGCDGKDKTFVFNEISPKPYGHNVWKGLNDLWTGFNCEKAGEGK